MNELSNLKPPKGAVKKRNRVGRGMGSGNGKTSGRGHKGQKSRSGGKPRVGFEGGQMPLQRRLPKRGFSNYPHKFEFLAINVSVLDRFDDGTTIDIDALKQAGIAKGHDVRVKITGSGELKTKLVVKASRIAKKGQRPERTRVERKTEYLVVSTTAAEKIQAAGGQVEVL